MFVTTTEGLVFTGAPTACTLSQHFVSTARAPAPSILGLARVSNRFCGFDGGSRMTSCVSFIAVGSQVCVCVCPRAHTLRTACFQCAIRALHGVSGGECVVCGAWG
jgi:hypothetical protein